MYELRDFVVDNCNSSSASVHNVQSNDHGISRIKVIFSIEDEDVSFVLGFSDPRRVILVSMWYGV